MTELAIVAAILVALGLGLYLGRRLAMPKAPVAPVLPSDRISISTLADPALVIEHDIAIAANPEARRLFGDRIAGSDLRLTVRHPGVLDALEEARGTGRTIEREINGIGLGNSAYRLRAVGAGEGRVLLLFDDITQARATERMRVDFIANASHELRTPLTTLTGFIETLQGPAADDPPARARFLDIMAREAARMSRLIDDLLSLSRIELDKHVRPVSTIAVAGMIAEVGRTMAMRFERDSRMLIIEEMPSLPLVTADRDQVLQVLHNLISNAIKYGDTGTPITVNAAAEPANGAQPALVRFTVADVGEGIAAEHLPRLTERFYRVDSQRSRTMGGTGLGLAIVKHIVERHRGRFELDSTPGSGSRASFTLPQAPEGAAITVRPGAAPMGQATPAANAAAMAVGRDVTKA